MTNNCKINRHSNSVHLSTSWRSTSAVQYVTYLYIISEEPEDNSNSNTHSRWMDLNQSYASHNSLTSAMGINVSVFIMLNQATTKQLMSATRPVKQPKPTNIRPLTIVDKDNYNEKPSTWALDSFLMARVTDP
jgi:hypothetical protein